MVKAPDFAAKVVLMGTFAHGQPDGSKAFFRNIIEELKADKLPDFAPLYAKDMLSSTSFANNPHLVAIVTQIPLALGKNFCINHSNACISWNGCIPKIKNITAQTLILVGENDNAVPFESHKQLNQLIINSRLEIISNSGHFMPLEKPDIVNKFIYDWLI